MTVREVCTRSVATVRATDTVAEAAQRMRGWRVAGLVVTDDAQRPIGIVTERDVVIRGVVRSPDGLGTLPVRDIMSGDVATARADETLNGVLRRMRGLGVRRLPVVSADGVLEGMVTLDDVLGVMSDELQDLIQLMGQEHQHCDDRPRCGAATSAVPV